MLFLWRNTTGTMFQIIVFCFSVRSLRAIIKFVFRCNLCCIVSTLSIVLQLINMTLLSDKKGFATFVVEVVVCPVVENPLIHVNDAVWSTARFNPRNNTFLLYVTDLLQLVKRRQLHPHVYVDDTQIYGLCNLADVDILQECISNCLQDVTAWTLANRLQLNPRHSMDHSRLTTTESWQDRSS